MIPQSVENDYSCPKKSPKHRISSCTSLQSPYLIRHSQSPSPLPQNSCLISTPSSIMRPAFLPPLSLTSKPLSTLQVTTTLPSFRPCSQRRFRMTAVPPPKTPTPLTPPPPPPPNGGPFRFLRRWWNRQSNKAVILRNYGIAAVISYGLFDAITYSISFVLALRAFLAAGKVLTWKTLPQVGSLRLLYFILVFYSFLLYSLIYRVCALY